MSKNITKPAIMLTLVAFLVSGIVLAVIMFGGKTHITKPEDVEVENIITKYIQTKHLNIRPHTAEYKIFLRGILFGEYPGLTNSQNEKKIVDYILNYLEIPREKEEDLPLPPLNTPN